MGEERRGKKIEVRNQKSEVGGCSEGKKDRGKEGKMRR